MKIFKDNKLKDRIKLFTHLEDINNYMSNECSWLHEKLELLPLFKFLFNLKELPNNGIYFFYERNEDASFWI